MHIVVSRLIIKRTVKECIVKGKWNNKKHLINSIKKQERKTKGI